MRNSRNPTGQSTAYLFRQVGKSQTLYEAWVKVRSSARRSNDPETRRHAQEIDADFPRVLRLLQRSLGNRSFRFEPQRGALKKRPGKSPRPIVIAPLFNRIIQRAVLDVCQSTIPFVRKRLGDIPRLLATPTSVGAQGVPKAMTQIQNAIEGGASWYVRSDIVDFFTKVPKHVVRDFLQSNVLDREFVDLYMTALETELSNPDEVRSALDAFPLGNIGVPQGSSLSALSANIVLEMFDRVLNGRGVTTIRYLDDFVALGPSKSAVQKVWLNAQHILSDLGMELHSPWVGGSKASIGQVRDGFEFLSFRIDDRNLSPSRDASLKLLRDIDSVIQGAKQIIVAGRDERRAEDRFAQALVLIDRKIRGWGDAFRSTTQRLVFSQLDDQLDSRLRDFMAWFAARSANASARSRRRMLGVALLSDTPNATLDSPAAIAA